MKAETFSFSISERGESTGETFNWSFTAKRRLSIRDRITKDSIRRQLVGERPETAEPATIMRAEMLAQLQVSLTVSPKAWRDAGNGLDLFDDNVIIAVYEKVMEEQNKAVEQAEKAGDDAKEKLRKVARTKKAEEEAEPAKE
jgi:hypothetical protein